MIRRLLASMALGAISLVASIAIAPSAEAAPPSAITCSGIISSGTYSSLVVPASSTCDIEGTVTITSPVSMGIASHLFVIFGYLTVEGALRVSPESFIYGNNVTVDGPLFAQSNSDVTLSYSTIGGPLSANDVNTLVLGEGRIGGPLRVQGSVPPGTLLVEGNHISGPVSVTNFNGTGGLANNVMGPLTVSVNLSSNPGGIFVSGNTVNGPATCSDNTPAPNSGLPPPLPNVVSGPIRGDQAAICIGDPAGD